MEGPRAGDPAMTRASELRSGKSHRDENFPVASRLIEARHRPAILAFYEFVRTADDIADHASLSESEKLRLLDDLEAGLLGRRAESAEADALRNELEARALSPRHAQDLLTAFRMDVAKRRYADWPDLIRYCSYSAMPVGRFVLDVHGEDRATWPASDALCASLQIINHLQDCGEDYRKLDRVYVPLDALGAAGAGVEDLGATKATANLRACLRDLAIRTKKTLAESAPLPSLVRNARLAVEIGVIQALASRILQLLAARDPLSERVHVNAAEAAVAGLAGACGVILRRIRRAAAPSRASEHV